MTRHLIFKINILFILTIILVFMTGDNNAFSLPHDEANKLFLEGDYKSALNIYKDIENSDDENSATLFLNIGNTFYRQSNYTKALEYYKKAIKDLLPINDENKAVLAQSYHNIGNAYALMKNFSEALVYYKESLRIFPLEYKTKYNYNLVKHLLNQKKQNNQNQQNDKNQQNNQGNQGNQNQQNDKNQQNENKQNQDKQNQDKQNQDKQKENNENNSNQNNENKDKEDKNNSGTSNKINNNKGLKDEDFQYLDALKYEENKKKQKIWGYENNKNGKVKYEKDW